jgi:hypothetical protein
MERWLDLHARWATSAAALALAPIPRFPGVGAAGRMARRSPARNAHRAAAAGAGAGDGRCITLRSAPGKKVVFVGDLERCGFGFRVF